MTDKAKVLRDLAERVEAASDPCRELDVRVNLAVSDQIWSESDIADLLTWRDEPTGYGRYRPADEYVPEHTRSLDAAMTLVPEGWAFSLGEMMGLPLEQRWRCHLRDHNEPYNPSTCRWLDRDCRTPALAVCAAALRAHAAIAEQQADG